MRDFFRYIRQMRFNYKPLVEVLIYKDRLLKNLNSFRKDNDEYEIAPVLKSNAYGHGLVKIAKILDKEDIPFLIVDSYYEALILRNEKVKSKILIIGYTDLENISNNQLKNIVYTISSLDQLKKISLNLKKQTEFHIKIDTGMHRNGILIKDFNRIVEYSYKNKNIMIDGVCSHLADADGDKKDFTIEQIKKWNTLTEIWYEKFPKTKYYHLSATAGYSYKNQINGNVLRLGLGLYGMSTKYFRNLDLKPVLEMRSIISSIKEIKKGDKVGYNITFEAKKDMKIATIPTGYFEGVDRRLSNKGFVKIKNAFCPIIGRVSMNVVSVDVSKVKNIKEGNSVIVLSSNRKDKNSIENIAKVCETIPYVILVHIPEKLRRVIV